MQAVAPHSTRSPTGSTRSSTGSTRSGSTHSGPTRSSPGVVALAGDAWTIDALRAVWARQQDRVQARLDALERAIAALAEDRLDPGLRDEAERAAHMLAGSVGMFGFLGASSVAHELERAITGSDAGRAPRLSRLLQDMREDLRGPVALRSHDARQT